MSRRTWATARALLPLGVLIVAAVWPVLAGGPPAEVDGPQHFYRFVALDRVLAQGVLYPRWLPDLHYGFGAPLLNYYAPATYYLLALLRLGALPYLWAFTAGFGLAVAGMAAGMYAWVRAEFGSPAAGLAAAAAYVFSPYLYKTALERAALPELLALALAPWLGWLLWRWARRPTWGAYAALAGGATLLLLTHSVSTLVFAPVLGSYALLQVPGRPARARWLAGLALAGAHALLLAAFFLVPFVAQAGAVQWERATAVAQYQDSFLRVGELLAWPVAYDAAHITNFMPNSLGWPQLALACGAVATLGVRRGRFTQARAVAGMALAVGLCAGLTLRNSDPVWQALPLLGRLQFPWRWVAPATLGLAWLAGAAVARLGSRWQPAALGATLAGCYLFSLSWSFHAPFAPLPAFPTGTDSLQAQIADRFYTFEFLPRDVRQLPAAETLAARYAAGDPPDRLGPLPAGVTILAATHGALAQTVRYEAEAAARLTWYQFAYPGWQATVDGGPVPVSAVGAESGLGVAVPAGTHTVRVFFGATPATRAGTLLSVGAVAAWLVVAWLGWRTRQGPPQLTAGAGGLSLGWVVLLAGLWLARVGVIERVETPWTYSARAHIQYPLAATFGDLALLGADWPADGAVAGGETLTLTLYWQLQAPVNSALKSQVQLRNAAGEVVAEAGNYHIAQWPTIWWPVGRYARDQHTLTLPVGLPPGPYTLTAGVYALEDNDPAHVVTYGYVTDDGRQGQALALGTVVLGHGAPLPDGPLALARAELNATEAQVGEVVAVRTEWHTGPAPQAGWSARVSLTEADGGMQYQVDLPPAGSGYPSAQWQPNELLRQALLVRLPADLPASNLTVSVALVNDAGLTLVGPMAAGTLQVRVPVRTFTAPVMQQRVNYDYGGLIRLLGYDVTAEKITFYWQALAAIPQPYKVFLHRLDATGNMVAGQDAEPARRTTSWLPGEVIVDPRVLAVGEHWQVGWYDEGSGVRLGEPWVVAP